MWPKPGPRPQMSHLPATVLPLLLKLVFKRHCTNVHISPQVRERRAHELVAYHETQPRLKERSAAGPAPVADTSGHLASPTSEGCPVIPTTVRNHVTPLSERCPVIPNAVRNQARLRGGESPRVGATRRPTASAYRASRHCAEFDGERIEFRSTRGWYIRTRIGRRSSETPCP